MPTFIATETISGYSQVKNAFIADDEDAARLLFEKWLAQKSHGNGGRYALSKSTVDASTYHPRMARPQNGFPTYINMKGPGPFYRLEESGQPCLPHNPASLSSSLNQLSILVRDLKEIFRTIEPDAPNLNAYGHQVRNTLLIAAMEFENECKGVLLANGYVVAGYWNTNSYVRVANPLRLSEYTVSLPFYPNIPAKSPLQGWDQANPTRSLPWYDAYNAVKHDRENQFNRATIDTTLDAVISCAIMLAAQYRLIPMWRDQIGEFFNFEFYPEWPPEDRYTHMHDSNWRSEPYPF